MKRLLYSVFFFLMGLTGILFFISEKDNSLTQINILYFNDTDLNSNYFRHKQNYIFKNYSAENSVLFFPDAYRKLKIGLMEKNKPVNMVYEKNPVLNYMDFSGTVEIKTDSNFKINSRAIQKQNLIFYMIEIIADEKRPETVSKKSYKELLINSVKESIYSDNVQYDFLIVAGNVSFEMVGNICRSIPEIGLFIWRNKEYELHKEKKIWYGISVVNSGIDNQYIGITKLFFNKFDKSLSVMNTFLEEIEL